MSYLIITARRSNIINAKERFKMILAVNESGYEDGGRLHQSCELCSLGAQLYGASDD